MTQKVNLEFNYSQLIGFFFGLCNQLHNVITEYNKISNNSQVNIKIVQRIKLRVIIQSAPLGSISITHSIHC